MQGKLQEDSRYWVREPILTSHLNDTVQSRFYMQQGRLSYSSLEQAIT